MAGPRVISLGWFLPRGQDAEAVAKQYARLLHLPLLRGYMSAWLFWAGETVVFEPKSDGGPEWRYDDWRSSPTLPVLRCIALSSVLARLRAFKADIIEDQSSDGWAIWRDCDGHFVRLEQSPAESALPNDMLALERIAQRANGTQYNPWTAPMPEDIYGIDRIIRHVADLSAMQAFYRDVLGLPILDHSDAHCLHDCCDGTTLELRSGGHVETVPTDRFEVPDTFILRVNDFDGYQDKLKAANVQLINERIQFGRGCLGYLVDPEGHLIGYEERYDQAGCSDGAIAFEEDLEANRRARKAAS
ncbi:MAG: VOC family protein [Pseudomonadota bacterium]